MTGRTRLSWVTALTVASLLLGGGALNVFADGRGGGNGKGHGGGSGNVEHQQQVQQQSPAEVHHDVQSSSHGNSQASEHGNSQVADDRRGGDMDDDVDAAADLVTAPALVTEETRPGLGCGDKNFVHTGPPGNPDKECKDKDNDDEDQGEVEVDED